MNRFLTYLLSVACVAVVCGCGEDRTHELEEKTQHNHWLLDEMRDKYLWGDTLATIEPTWKDFFATPYDFLAKLTSKASKTDKWSYVEVDTIAKDVRARGHFNHIDSYGFDFVIMNDPTGQTTKQFARVITVIPGSPAHEAKLKRNDFISEFDTYKVSNNNTARLERGAAHTLTVRRLRTSTTSEELEWSDPTILNLGASRRVEDIPFPVNQKVDVGGIKVGYLMCNQLVADAATGTQSQRLTTIIDDFKRSEVNEIVLDLRLCNYGTMEMASRLASHIVAPSHVGKVFASTVWNTRYSANNRTYLYDASVTNIGVGRVYVLTSSYTRGAAEWLIHSLQSTMGKENVIVIGKSTAGQNVMTQEIGHEYHIALCPAVAYVADHNGDYDYGAIAPSVAVDEMNFAELYEYGEPDEPLFRAAIMQIAF